MLYQTIKYDVIFLTHSAFFNYFLHIIFLCVDHFIKLFKKVSFSVDAYFCPSLRPAPYSISQELFHFLDIFVLRTTREAGEGGGGGWEWRGKGERLKRLPYLQSILLSMQSLCNRSIF